jgi:hypothetical protein
VKNAGELQGNFIAAKIKRTYIIYTTLSWTRAIISTTKQNNYGGKGLW